MKIEIITTGDEVVNGVIIDTNSAWIAERCAKLGHELLRHTSIPDDIEPIVTALKESAAGADAVIVTGGLGPTADDITIAAAAKAFGAKLVKDEEILTLIPEGGVVLSNRVGTAPGVRIKFRDTEFFFLPGVPKELYQIFEDSVTPWLARHSSVVAHEIVLRCFGMPEASIDEKLRGVELSGTRLSFRVRFPEILLKVLARADSVAKAKSSAEMAAAAIKERLGDVVYAEGNEELPAVVGRMLIERKMTIAIAESCTGGHIADEITNVAGASLWFERGIVSYSNKSKQELLGVSEESLRANGAVSRETAMAMAEGIRRRSGASLGVGVTGIAGPSGGTTAKPVGTVHIAVSSAEGTKDYEFHLSRDRIWFKQFVSWMAFDLVRKYLTGSPLTACGDDRLKGRGAS